jgi:YggT family protein
LGAAMISLIHTIIDVYSFILFIAVILSWVNLDRDNPVLRFVTAVTEPVLAPIRRVLPPMGGFDLSPLVLFIGLRLLQRLI